MPTGTRGARGGRTPRSARALRWIVLALLLLSAVLTLAGLPELQREVAAGRVPRAALAIPPALLALFILGYAAYRLVLVRAGRYPAGKALVQIGLMVLVLTLALPGSLDRWRSAGTVRVVDLSRHLNAPDAETRALAAELARHRDPPEALRYVPRLVELLDDGSPEVRRQARASLAALAGDDVGGEGPDAAKRWRAYWRAHGVAGLR